MSLDLFTKHVRYDYLKFYIFHAVFRIVLENYHPYVNSCKRNLLFYHWSSINAKDKQTFVWMWEYTTSVLPSVANTSFTKLVADEFVTSNVSVTFCTINRTSWWVLFITKSTCFSSLKLATQNGTNKQIINNPISDCKKIRSVLNSWKLH